jgi:hypothetical protein
MLLILHLQLYARGWEIRLILQIMDSSVAVSNV